MPNSRKRDPTGAVDRLLRAGFDRLSEGVVVFNRRGLVTYFNESARRLLQREAAEMHGDALSSWRPHDLSGRALPADEWPVRLVFASGQPVRDLILGDTAANGTTRWLRVNIEPLVEAGVVEGVIASFTDETEAHHVSDALRSNEAITQQLMEALADGVFVAQDRRFVFANRALEQILGYAHGTFVGADFSQVIAESHHTTWIERYTRRIGSGPEPVRGYETCFMHVDGTTRIDLDLVATRTLYEGRAAVLGVVRDIRERKRVEIELEHYRHGLEALVAARTAESRHALEAKRDSESFVQDVTDRLPALIAYIDKTLRIRFANDAWLRWFGWSREQAIGMTIQDVVPGDHVARSMADIDRVLSGEPVETFVDMTNCEGAVRHFQISRRPDIHEGVVRGFQIIATDITELRNNEHRLQSANRALMEAERFTRNISDNLPVRIAYWDHELRCRFVNKAYRAWHQGTPESLLGRVHDEIFDDPMLGDRMRRLRAALDGQPDEFQREDPSPDGTSTHSQVHLIPDQHGDEVRGVFVLGIDVTEQHRHQTALTTLNEQLVMARDRAESAAKAKASFLANMSHEIRTPLNAVIGLTHAVRRHPGDPANAERMTRVAGAAEHLLQIVNDVLDLSKIDAGKVVVESVPFAIADVLARACGLVAEQARSKGLELAWSGERVPAHGIGDPTRISQALLNLLGNAVKFTERGRIDLDASVLESDADGMLVRFEVRDTGIGIAPEHLPHLFNAFEQADASTTRRFGGTGLGLALTRHLARLMGGEADARSAVGAGSTFWITVRLRHGPVEIATVDGGEVRRPQPVAELDMTSEDTLRDRYAGTRILVAEDNVVNQEVALSLLESAGLQVDIAEDGRRAVELALANDYALVLMDMQMPRLDGLDACREIRRSGRHVDLPIVAMTANAFAEDRGMALAAGMNDHVSKPVDPPLLYRVITRWLDWRASRSHASTADIEAAALAALDTIEELDTESGVAFFAGRVSPYLSAMREFVRMYSAGLPPTDGTAMGVRRELHGTGSACASVGAAELGALAHALLAQLRQHDDAHDRDATLACEAQFSSRLRTLSGRIAETLTVAGTTVRADRATQL